MNKIYCVGDGFAHGHIWPEWPQLLEALMPDYRVNVISGIGAGSEYLVTNFSKLLPIDGIVIFQWPEAQRFDKIIEDSAWSAAVKQDPVYHFNTYCCDNVTWWLSSGSKNKDIIDYHTKYVQSTQAQVRVNVYQNLINEILKNAGYPYVFTSTAEQDKHSQKDRQVRGEEIQPSPLSHWYFLTEFIMPAVGLHSNLTQQIKELLMIQKWIPYDPDRAEIWQNIKNQLHNLADK